MGNSTKKKKRRIKNLGRVAAFVFLGLLIAGAGIGYAANRHVEKVVNVNTIYPNIRVEGIDIGGLSKEQAKQKLQDEIGNVVDQKQIILYYEEQNWVLPYQQLGSTFNYDEIIEKAFDIGREGSLWERYRIIKALEDDKTSFSLKYTYDTQKIYQAVEDLKERFTVEAESATIKREKGQFFTTPEKIGLALDVENTVEKVKELMNRQEDGKVELVVQKTIPTFIQEDLMKIQHVLGSFTTTFDPKAEGRAVNVGVAASKINGHLLGVGEVFSVNQEIGPTNRANGYLDAPIIVNGKLEDGIGGGVCQVASTLYNAVVFSELKIVERQNHSLQVGYVDIGMDATLAGDYIDFKFQNSTTYPIYVESYTSSGKLYVNIYGFEERPSNRKIEFESVVTERVPPPAEKVTEDPNLESGKRVVDVQPKEGIKVKVYKKIYEGGKLVEREVLNSSYYRPRRAEVRVGTKPVAVAPTIPEVNTEQAVNPPSNHETDTDSNIDIADAENSL